MQIDDNGNATNVLYNGNDVLINGGADGDLIENYGAFGTINGGTGNDTIKNFGVLLVNQNKNIIGTAPVTNYYYQIDGSSGDDYIYNENDSATISGGQGNDTLTGGKGNDSLWGNVGKDTFVYADGDGKDIIYDFANDDILKITGKFSGSYDKKIRRSRSRSARQQAQSP